MLIEIPEDYDYLMKLEDQYLKLEDYNQFCISDRRQDQSFVLNNSQNSEHYDDSFDIWPDDSQNSEFYNYGDDILPDDDIERLAVPDSNIIVTVQNVI